MLTRVLGSRGLMSTAVVVILVLLAAIAVLLSRPHPDMRSYCADMPDSVGLYRGSAVTIMGVSVGRVTDIQPDGATAHVRFTVPAGRALPLDVGAVTVSDTVIADRHLALIGPEPAGPGWDPHRCITRTLTPKSLSQTFDALSTLTAQLHGSTDPQHHDAGLDALDRATAGTGEQVNGLILGLSRALDSPDAAIGHLGALLDALAELSHRAVGAWPQVQTSVTGLAQTLTDINLMAIAPIIALLDGLHETLPQLNDVLEMYGTPALRALDSVADLPHLMADGIGSLSDIIRMAPAVASGFAGAIDPSTGRFTVTYASPKLALPQQDTSRICAAMQAITGQHCDTSSTGVVSVPALPALLAGVSAK